MDQQAPPPSGGYQPPPQYGGYPPPPGSGGGSAAASKVAAPAIAIIVTASLSIVFYVLRILAQLAFPEIMNRFGQDENMNQFAEMGQRFAIFICLFGLLANVVALLGAIKMKSLQSYTLAMVATILIMIPCNCPCCILGLPIGIWSLVVLLNSEVKAAFRS